MNKSLICIDGFDKNGLCIDLNRTFDTEDEDIDS